METAIDVQDLGKTYAGGVEAVKGVTFSVPRGQIFGFLGPNGAGKTTTVSMLTTLLRPTKGRATVAGLDVTTGAEAVRRKIGLVFQASTADGDLTGRENLELQAGLYNMSPAESRPRIRELLQQMDLVEAADRRAKGYSGGMKRRLELAVAMVHTPAILFLDEPTLGLDPQGRAGFWRYIQGLRREHDVTIFMTTHYLDEVEGVCDRISIIDHGTIIASGTTDTLKEKVGGDVVELKVSAAPPELLPALRELPGTLDVKIDGQTVRVKCPRGELAVAGIIKACERSGVGAESLSIQRPSLDTVFLELTGKAYREEGYDAGRAQSVFAAQRAQGDR